LRAFLPGDIPDQDVNKFVHYYTEMLQINPSAQSALDSELYPITNERALEVISQIYTDESEQSRIFEYFKRFFI
jgi:hypothetical protein